MKYMRRSIQTIIIVLLDVYVYRAKYNRFYSIVEFIIFLKFISILIKPSPHYNVEINHIRKINLALNKTACKCNW